MAFLMLAKVSCISWVIGLLTLSGGLFAQGEEEQKPLNRAEWKHLRSLHKVRPLFWIGPLRNEAVYGICLTPIGFREHYNAVVNGLNLEVLGIGTAYTIRPDFALSGMDGSFASMDTIPEVYNFQVNGVSLGSGFVQRGVLNGIGVGGGLIGKLNGISVGVVNLMYRANGLVIGAVVNQIAEMRGLEIAFFNGVRFRMRGVQLALLGNVVSTSIPALVNPILEDSLSNEERGLIGLQVGYVNVVSYSASGMQIGFLNRVHGKLEGIQMGFDNMGNTLQGMQISVAENRCRTLQGVQIGFFNECSSLRGIQNGKLEGTQMGFDNMGNTLQGMQISVAENRCRTLQGVQIGFLNECSSLRGVQIGLLNFCEGRLSPFLRVKLQDRRLTTSEPSSESLP